MYSITVSENNNPEFGAIPIFRIVPDKSLPADIFVKINEKYIRFKITGDNLPSAKYDYFISKNVESLYAKESDISKFFDWITQVKKEAVEDIVAEVGEDNREVAESYQNLKETVVDVFTAEELSDEKVLDLQAQAADFIEKVSKFKTTINSIAKLTRFSQNVADHSLNVANLSVFFSLVLGNNHQLVLENIYMGGIFHDYGKAKMDHEILENPTHPRYEKLLKSHPEVGVEAIAESKVIPPQVNTIIVQHHECYDGSGYPRGLRGEEIYKLSRIISMANEMDTILSKYPDSIEDGYRAGIKILSEDGGKLFDPEMAPHCAKALEHAIFGEGAS